MMCASSRSSLMMLIIEASVVVLPEPVGPVTSSSPRGWYSSSFAQGGRPICSIVSILLGDLPEHHAEIALLLEHAHTETRQASPKAETEVRAGRAFAACSGCAPRT